MKIQKPLVLKQPNRRVQRPLTPFELLHKKNPHFPTLQAPLSKDPAPFCHSEYKLIDSDDCRVLIPIAKSTQEVAIGRFHHAKKPSYNYPDDPVKGRDSGECSTTSYSAQREGSCSDVSSDQEETFV